VTVCLVPGKRNPAAQAVDGIAVFLLDDEHRAALDVVGVRCGREADDLADPRVLLRAAVLHLAADKVEGAIQRLLEKDWSLRTTRSTIPLRDALTTSIVLALLAVAVLDSGHGFSLSRLLGLFNLELGRPSP
jgi:hypothetical protein